MYESFFDVAAATNLLNEVITVSDLHKIAALFEKEKWEAGFIIWDIGDTAEYIYMVESGELNILVKSNSEYQLSETLLSGTMAGEIEVFTKHKYSNRLVSKNDSVVMKLSREAFESLSQSDPSLALKLVRLSLSFDYMRQKITSIQLCKI